MQIHQLMDACIVALSFWLAFELRNNHAIMQWLDLPPVPLPFDAYVWLYLLLIPAAPLILEAQGFYSRPMVPSRRTTWWMIFKSCGIMTLGLILGLFLLRIIIARWVVIWFGFISFGLLVVKEEVLRWAVQTRLARSQYRRRLLLIGPVSRRPVGCGANCRASPRKTWKW
jgi:FlaA1/EpsC-like NDP-sugar epimerase